MSAEGKRRGPRKPAREMPRLGPRKRAQKVKPLQGKAAAGDYQYGFKKPPERSPWIDEGDPEVNG